MLSGLLLAGVFWADIGPKQALVCPPASIASCLAMLPESVRQQLPAEPTRYHDAIALRAAMTIAVADANIAGIVLWAPELLPASQSALWNSQVYQLPLQQQPLLTLWHELGHLEVHRLQGNLLPTKLSELEQEWLADSYLLWRSARSSHSLALAWQQYHRRNFGVMADIGNLSHWTSPYLLPLLQRYSVGQLEAFTSFADFVADFFPQVSRYDADALSEFSSLLQRLFGAGSMQPLPDYLSWRRPALGRVLQPTLAQVMGASQAAQWMQQQKLNGNG